MEGFSQELLLTILRGLPPLAIRNFIISCSSFFPLRDHKVLIPLVSAFVPHRDTTGHTLPQVIRLCGNHPPNRAAILSSGNGEAKLFLKEGKVYLDQGGWLGSFSSSSGEDDISQDVIAQLELTDATDVFSSGSSFTVVGKGYCALVSRKAERIVTEVMRHPELNPIQVIRRMSAFVSYFIIVNNDGRLFIGAKPGEVPFINIKITPVSNIPSISHIERLKGKSQIIDVDGGGWIIEDDGSVTRDSGPLFSRRRDELRKWLQERPESRLAGVTDIYGLLYGESQLMCTDDGIFLLIKENGSVETVKVTGCGGGEYYYSQEKYGDFYSDTRS